MLKIQVLGKGMIPRGLGLAPRKEPFPADLTLIQTILNTRGDFKINFINPETGKFAPLTKQNCQQMYRKYGDIPVSSKNVDSADKKEDEEKDNNSSDSANTNPINNDSTNKDNAENNNAENKVDEKTDDSVKDDSDEIKVKTVNVDEHTDSNDEDDDVIIPKTSPEEKNQVQKTNVNIKPLNSDTRNQNKNQKNNNNKK